MPPVPDNQTDRYFVDYSTCGESHTMLVRAISGTAQATVLQAIDDFLSVFDTNDLWRMQITQVRLSLTNQSVSFPISWTGAAFYGDGAIGPHDRSAAYYTFVGRDTGGRRARLTLFGAKILSGGQDYRLTSDEASFVSGALSVLQFSGDVFVTANTEQPVWSSYANSGINAYWRNRIR